MPRRALTMTWRPHDGAAWERETAECSLAGRGALVTLADALWRSPVGPCAVPDDDATLALWCRARREWAQVAPDVRLVLAPHPTVPGALTWPWLLRVWEDQQAAYTRRAAAGRRGGNAKAAGSNATRSAPADCNSIATEWDSIATSEGSTATLPAAPSSDPPPDSIATASGSNANQMGSNLQQIREREKDSPPADAEGRESFSLTRPSYPTTAPSAPPPSAPEGRAASRSRLASPNRPPDPVGRILASVVPEALRPRPPAPPWPEPPLVVPKPVPLDPPPFPETPHVARP